MNNIHMSTKDTIQRIISIEWEMFDFVNKGKCRASCQEDPDTFVLMRRSQFEAWCRKLLDSYLTDLLHAQSNGQNLIELKYFYMMYLKELDQHIDEPNYPSIEIYNLVNRIMVHMNDWTQKLILEFPELKYCARPISSAEDSPYDTSIETYQKCELYTYSAKTLKIYYDYIKQLKSAKKNLPFMIVRNTALLQRANSENS